MNDTAYRFQKKYLFEQSRSESRSPIAYTTLETVVSRPSLRLEGNTGRKEGGWLGAIFDALLATKLVLEYRLLNLRRQSDEKHLSGPR